MSSDVARRVGVTPDAVRAAVRRGHLQPAGKSEGGVYVFNLAAVAAWQARRAAKAQATA